MLALNHSIWGLGFTFFKCWITFPAALWFLEIKKKKKDLVGNNWLEQYESHHWMLCMNRTYLVNCIWLAFFGNTCYDTNHGIRVYQKPWLFNFSVIQMDKYFWEVDHKEKIQFSLLLLFALDSIYFKKIKTKQKILIVSQACIVRHKFHVMCTFCVFLSNGCKFFTFLSKISRYMPFET